ncbi:MAG: MFS transporter [Bacillota bacterium]
MGAAGTDLRQPLWTRDFILICLTNFLLFTSFQFLMPVLPLYLQNLGAEKAVIGFINGIFTVAAVSVRPWVGRGLDKNGRRSFLLGGLLFFSLTVLTYRWSSLIWLVLAIRLLQGVSWGFSSTAASTVAADIIPSRRRGEGMGFYGMSTNVAMALAPGLGLLLLGARGFPAAFYAAFLLGMAALFLASRIAYQPLQLEQGGQRPALFEKSAFYPSMVSMIMTMGYGGVVSFLPLFAHEHGIENIGPFFTAYALTLMAGRPLSGFMYDRKGPHVMVIPGILLCALGGYVLSLAESMPGFLLAAAIYGAGFGASMPALSALAIARVSPARRGAASATYFSSFDLGIGFGAIFLGFLSQWMGYAYMYRVAALITLSALVVYWAFRPREGL